MDNSCNKLSLREKALFKRRINKEHNSNMRAGFVHIHEEQLSKSGLRGHKLIAVYVITFLLALFAFANIVVTILIVKTLEINDNGAKTLEFTAPGKMLSFKEDCEINNIMLVKNSINSNEDDIELSGANRNAVHLDASGDKGPSIRVTNEEVDIVDVEKFSAVDFSSGKTIFSTDYYNYQFPRNTKIVRTHKILTDQVRSPRQKNLEVSTGDTGNITLTGKKFVKMQGKTVSMSARKSLHISGGNTLSLETKSGMYFNDVLNLPKLPPNIPGDVNEIYKICVCAENGRLFKVIGNSRCDQGVNNPSHPCVV